MAVPTLGSVTHGRTSGSQATLTISAIVAAGEQLAVGVAVWSGVNVSATYGGVAMQRIDPVTSAGSYRMAWFILRSPAAGTANVVITAVSSTWMAAGCYSIVTTANAAFTVGTPAGGNSTAPSCTIASDANALVLDILGDDGNNITKTVGAGQTSLFQEDSVANTDVHGSGSWKAGAASVTMAWTLSAAKDWGICAVSITETTSAGARISQLDVETISFPTPTARVSQLDIETVARPVPVGRVSQIVVETITTSLPAGGIRVSQLVIETIAVNLSPSGGSTTTFPALTVAP